MSKANSNSGNSVVIVPLSCSSSTTNALNLQRKSKTARKKGSMVRAVNCVSIICLAVLIWIRILLEEEPLGLFALYSADNDNNKKTFQSRTSSSSAAKTESFAATWRHWWNRNNDVATFQVPGQCTNEQVAIIAKHLPASDCKEYSGQPWFQKCSFSYATRCHDRNAKWLFDFYNNNKRPKFRKTEVTLSSEPMKAVFLGCSNNGVDAVNILRTMSANTTFDKQTWKNQLLAQGINSENSCAAQVHTEPVSPTTRNAVAYCIEGNPDRAAMLEKGSKHLEWQSSFVVQNVEILTASRGAEDGTTALQPYSGTENAENCNNEDTTSKCKQVRKYKLSKLVDTLAGATGTIDFLSIGMEGLDWDILLGGLKALRRVQYVQFQYNWKGDWSKHSLSTVVSTFKYVGFTCYWAGTHGNLWRITDCWLDHYSSKVWSHVVCVNHELPASKPLATKMEHYFNATLEKSISYFSDTRVNTDGSA